jgi:alpha-beta hydrolase superfamily lysophospholipase
MSTTAAELPERPSPLHTDVDLISLDGTKLKGRLWSQPQPRGLLLISHGLGEHSGSYRRTAEALLSLLPIDVLAVDFRGSGRSSGKRGVLARYEDLMADLDAANRWAIEHRPGLPRFLLGHSNGGLVAGRTVLERDLGVQGLILSNPSLKVSAYVPAWKRLAGEFLRIFAPGVTLPTGLGNDQLTQDPEIVAELAADALRHDRISPPLYYGMLRSGPILLARAHEITLPTLLMLGGADTVVDPSAGRAFFDALGAADKSLKIYPEMRHEPLNEASRSAVLADLADWLRPRLRTGV